MSVEDADNVASVLAILPDMDRRRVEALLSKYGSAEEVINRCLDGLEVEHEGEGGTANEVIELDSDATLSTLPDTERNDLDDFSGDLDAGLFSSDFEMPVTRYVEIGADESFSLPSDELPDIPELSYEELASQPKPEEPVAPKPKQKRGRKKKDEAAGPSNEQMTRLPKKKPPTNVASVEVQLGMALLDKSRPELSDALSKALEVSGGVFEKNAVLPCPCHVTLWEEAPHPCAVRWVYHKPLSVLDNDEDSCDVVYAAPGSEFIAELQPELGVLLPLDDFISLCRTTGQLLAFCRRVASSGGESYRRLMLVTPDPAIFFKQRQSDQRKQLRQNLVTDEAGPWELSTRGMNLEDVETALASLDFAEPPLGFPVTVTFSTTSDHAAAIVRSMTKAVCERPGKSTKRQWDSVLVMEPGSTVNPTEKPYELWLRQLEQLTLVSGDVASAIASRFQTPMSLHCAAAAEGPSFAANLEIRRGAGVLERTRRVGPECSRRLHMLFASSTDPETIFE